MTRDHLRTLQGGGWKEGRRGGKLNREEEWREGVVNRGAGRWDGRGWKSPALRLHLWALRVPHRRVWYLPPPFPPKRWVGARHFSLLRLFCPIAGERHSLLRLFFFLGPLAWGRLPSDPLGPTTEARTKNFHWGFDSLADRHAHARTHTHWTQRSACFIEYGTNGTIASSILTSR